MKKIFSLFVLLSTVFAQPSSAQVIKGDMNDDGVFNITDVSESVNTVLGKRAIQYVQGGGDPYMVDNSRVVGTWYKTKSDHFTLNADGTTDYVTDYGEVATYEFLPYQGIIIFYDNTGKPLSWIEVKKLMAGRMICNIYDDGNKPQVLTTEVPPQLVTAIQLSATSLVMSEGESKQISATVLPEDADNKSVTWESSNESVAKVTGNLVHAIASGSAVIICRATDGSGVKAECKVTVQKKAVSHGFVDLGLPGGVLWATCNVGAEKPEDYGLYFAWGEIVGYAKDESHSFDWAHYDLCNGDEFNLTKYSTSTGYWDPTLGTSPDNKTVLDPEDDAATANWGTGWRMPTLQEMSDLYNSAYTFNEWVTVNGVSGIKITSRSNGNSIFLPATGYRTGANTDYEGFYGGFWSCEANPYDCYFAFSLNFTSEYIDWLVSGRCGGFPVRPVRVASK